MIPDRAGVKVPRNPREGKKYAWVWVRCRYCNCDFECIKGMQADRTKTCLWCLFDLLRGVFATEEPRPV